MKGRLLSHNIKLTFFYGYSRILRKVQGKERHDWRKRSNNEGEGRKDKKSYDRHLPQVRNQDVPDTGVKVNCFTLTDDLARRPCRALKIVQGPPKADT